MTTTIDAVIWRPYYITLPGNTPRCKYLHALIGDVVVVLDQNGPRSVTNDAERVCREMFAFYDQHHPIVYRDTEGAWDELEHAQGAFVNFRRPSARRGVIELAKQFAPA